VRACWWEISDGNHTAFDGGSMEIEVMAGFYADDGAIASTDPVHMQSGLDYLVELFKLTGLLSNTSKTNATVCTPNPLKVHISNQAYKWRMSGRGPLIFHGIIGECSVLFVKRSSLLIVCNFFAHKL
jgi:hypothetical protein